MDHWVRTNSNFTIAIGTNHSSHSYKMKGKYHEQIVKQSPFTLRQEQPGDFAITSIAHQHMRCKTAVDNINFQVHALPSAQVAHGNEYHENIHEGISLQIICLNVAHKISAVDREPGTNSLHAHWGAAIHIYLPKS